ncbi:hypothetical protein Uis4E_1472 [Bifidobacterium parmae]|uniref:Uncharacterized protein n=1 Tax=Bifidobacterium parmae TaxID=361854 RepID=A0A2N5J0A2_9BIFI|nr:hypothetical protein Uis4E_1472 [Bifidobacterium parmae]
MNIRKHIIRIFAVALSSIITLSIGTATASAFSFTDGYVTKAQSCIYARNPRTVYYVSHQATGSDSGGHLVTRTAPTAYSSTNATSCSTVNGLYGIQKGTGKFVYYSGAVRTYSA